MGLFNLFKKVDNLSDKTKKEIGATIKETVDIIDKVVVEKGGFKAVSLTEILSLGSQYYNLVPKIKELAKSAKKEEVVKCSVKKETKADSVAKKDSIAPNTCVVNSLSYVDIKLLLIVATVAVVTKQMADIANAQRETIAYLEMKERAKVKADVTILQGILGEYKFNSYNEKFKTNKHIEVQSIKRDAEQSITLYIDSLRSKISKKGWIQTDGSVKNKFAKIGDEFVDYKLAIYLYAFSSFLEVLLLENFNSNYLDDVSNKIQTHVDEYNKLNNDCYEQMLNESKGSLQANLMKGLGKVSEFTGKVFSKKKEENKDKPSECDENTQTKSDEKATAVAETFDKDDCSIVLPFIESVKTVEKIFNADGEVYFDSENVYFSNLTD